MIGELSNNTFSGMIGELSNKTFSGMIGELSNNTFFLYNNAEYLLLKRRLV